MSTIVAKQVRQEGTSIILKTNPSVGLLALTAFVDDATPDTGQAQFVKTFRYSLNGIEYSDWLPLTIPNITAIPLTAKSVFVAELNYFKNEAPGLNYLGVATATITATNDTTAIYKPYFDNSLFKRYFDSSDPEVLTWYINVLEKLYNKGLLASFVDRKNDDGQIEDFIAVFGAAAKFCAFYVKLARTYSQFYNNIYLLRDFLKQRGLTTSPEDTLPQLQEMLEQYFFHMAQRGTERIKNEDNGGVAGEFLRLVNSKIDQDEFMFNLYRSHHFGWNLSNSSPLFRGLRVNDSLNKVPWSKGGSSMTAAAPYITGSGLVTTLGGEDIVKFTGSGALQFGLNDKVKVSPDMDYQISFQIQLVGDMTLLLNGWDKNGNAVQCSSRKTGSLVTGFFNTAVLSRDDQYVTVKCYLYNRNRGVFGSDVLGIRQGSNLIAHPDLNKIGLTLSINGTADIKNFRIQPMCTEYSRGFVQANNFISSWVLNRNGEYTIAGLTDYVSRYLIPYNCHIKITNIGDRLYTAIQEDIETTYWVGAGEYCRKVLWIGSNPSCEVVTYVWVPDDSTAYCEQNP